mmetsp:Transcript_22604/g.64034  ORF Transcript_22604/g.64034 Transcript_22604/m.64034 type:complete len:92 (+) Transcript_22604:36-311(+)
MIITSSKKKPPFAQNKPQPKQNKTPNEDQNLGHLQNHPRDVNEKNFNLLFVLSDGDVFFFGWLVGWSCIIHAIATLPHACGTAQMRKRERR